MTEHKWTWFKSYEPRVRVEGEPAKHGWWCEGCGRKVWIRVGEVRPPGPADLQRSNVHPDCLVETVKCVHRT